MKILVTGANGYLGQGIIKTLLDNKWHVIATDFESSNIDKRAKIKCCNIFNIEDPFEYFDKPDVVLHLAWRNGFLHNADTHLEDLPKHNKWLKKIIDSGCNRISVMGSMHEIGFYEGCIDENTSCEPMTQYGIAKNALRQSIKFYANEKNVQFMWLRGYYIVSNNPHGSSIFAKIALSEEEGEKEFPFTLGENQYDYLEYNDFCKQVVAAVSQTNILGIINICSGKPEKLCDRVERFIKDNKYNIKLKYGVFPDRPYDSKAVWGNDKKINEIINTYGEKNEF